jgi:hypothetical protein
MNRSPGRIARTPGGYGPEHFRRYPTGGVADLFGGGEEGLTRRHDLFQVQLGQVGNDGLWPVRLGWVISQTL